MPRRAPIVFLSSRFDEFREIRQIVREHLRSGRALECQVVDFGENYPHEDPPLVTSQNAARTADIMVLLVGETYGEPPAGETRSLTQLEYAAASSAESNTIVLPYFFDCREDSRWRDDERLSAFRAEITGRHSYSQHYLDEDVLTQAMLIVQDILRKLVFLTGAERQVEVDFWMIPEEELGDDDVGEAVHQDRRIADDARLKLDADGAGSWSHAQLLANPARVGAAEQKREAVQAAALGEWRLAIWHLGQALERRPWDLAALFWCARYLLLSGLRADSQRALGILTRAARIAEKEIQASPNIPLAACYLLAARAATQLGEPRWGVEYAKQAHQAASVYWLTAYETARQTAMAGDVREALQWLRTAFYLKPASLVAAKRDAAFRPWSREVRELTDRIRDRTRADVEAILSAEQGVWLRLKAICDAAPGYWSEEEFAALREDMEQVEIDLRTLDQSSVLSLINKAQSSFDGLLGAVQMLGMHAQRLHAEEPGIAEQIRQAAAQYTEGTDQVNGEIQRIQRGEESVPFSPDRTIQVLAWIAALISGVLALASFSRGDISAALWSLLLFVVAAVGGNAAATGAGRSRARKRRTEELQRHLQSWEEWKHTRLAEIDSREQLLSDVLDRTVDTFLAGVGILEAQGLKRRVYCTTAALDRAAVGDYVRLDPAKHGDRYDIVDQLLPDDLLARYPDAGTLPAAGHCLYRLLPGSPNLIASRQACYFGHPSPPRN